MSSTYRGDSPGKKFSRFRVWLSMYRAAQALGIPYEGSLVLAGEGGDLSVLDSLQFPRRSVTAVDFDEEWLEYCAEVYPGVQTVRGEVGAASEGIPFSMAHLDFCGGISAANIKTVADVCWHVKALPSVVAVTMLKGREYMGGSRKELLGDVHRSVRRRHQLACRKNGDEIGEYILSTPKLDPRHLLHLSEKFIRKAMPRKRYEGTPCSPYLANGKMSPLGSAMVRASALQRTVQAVSALRGDCPGDGPRLTCIGVVGYHSRTKRAHGTPFLTALFAVSHHTQTKFVSDIMLRNPESFIFQSLDVKESLEQLAPSAAELAKVLPVEQVAKMFDVQPQTVVAWKAHASRGTYKAEPLLRCGYVDEMGVKATVPGRIEDGVVFRPIRLGKMM